jgi:23S rRNA U2552 (ribose-2'-O)-methylase RlmE/FtsJ
MPPTAALVQHRTINTTPHAIQGSGTQEFIKLMQRYFKKVARMRVDASRSMSREFYAVGLGRKPPADL